MSSCNCRYRSLYLVRRHSSCARLRVFGASRSVMRSALKNGWLEQPPPKAANLVRIYRATKGGRERDRRAPVIRRPGVR